MQAPPNSASHRAARQGGGGAAAAAHIHVVDLFNLDDSLDVASVLCSCRAVAAAASQVRISTSGLAPQLAAHPSLAAASASAAASFAYDSTAFDDGALAAALGWSPALVQRNAALGARGPRHFTSVEQECRDAMAAFVTGTNDLEEEEERSSGAAPSVPYFDIVVCCSRAVYNAVVDFYAARRSRRQGAAAATLPQVVYVMHVDERFARSAAAAAGPQQQQQPHQPAAARLAAAADAAASAKRPTLGQLVTSLVVELLGLQHDSEQQQHQQSSSGKHQQGSDEGAPLLEQFVAPRWKEHFAAAVKRFEQLRRVEILFTPVQL